MHDASILNNSIWLSFWAHLHLFSKNGSMFLPNPERPWFNSIQHSHPVISPLQSPKPRLRATDTRPHSAKNRSEAWGKNLGFWTYQKKLVLVTAYLVEPNQIQTTFLPSDTQLGICCTYEMVVLPVVFLVVAYEQLLPLPSSLPRSTACDRNSTEENLSKRKTGN